MFRSRIAVSFFLGHGIVLAEKVRLIVEFLCQRAIPDHVARDHVQSARQMPHFRRERLQDLFGASVRSFRLFSAWHCRPANVPEPDAIEHMRCYVTANAGCDHPVRRRPTA